MKIYPFYTDKPIFTIHQIYKFFESGQVEGFIVDLYRLKPLDSFETVAVNLIHEYNGCRLTLLVDYENGDDLYNLHIEKNNKSIEIKTDIISIKKAIDDIIADNVTGIA